MTELLDASVLCRYLVGEPAEQARRAAELIDSQRPLRISLMTLAETSHVLRAIYGHERAAVIDALTGLLRRENIAAHEVETELAIQALQLCRDSGRVSVVDSLLWCLARSATPARVWTFDRRFPTDQIEAPAPGLAPE